MSVRKGNSIIAKGDVPVDGVTITPNSNSSLQSIGNINKNTATGADVVKYDWVGTLAEYTAQNIETAHPEWTCYITDDQGGIGAVYNAVQSDLRYFKKDNEDKAIITVLGYPDVTRVISLTPLASGGEYTAPENGYFYTISAVTAQNAYTYIRYSANMNNMFRFLDWKYSSTGGLNVWCPTKAGEKVTINYNNCTITSLYFIPAYGQA